MACGKQTTAGRQASRSLVEEAKVVASHTQGNPRPIDAVLEHFPGARRTGAGWVTRCPAHEDRSPSLSITEGREQVVLLHCYGGCGPREVLAAVGLEWQVLFPRGSRKTRVFLGITPYTHGHAAFESFGDDVSAAMLGELGRVADIRGSLDQRVVAAFLVVATALGISRERFEEHLRDALSTEAPA